MKKAEITGLLADLQQHSESIQHSETTERLVAVAQFIDQLPGAKLADCLIAADKVTVTTTSSDGITCTDCAAVLSAYADLAKALGKAPIASKLDTISTALRSRSETFIYDLIGAVRLLPTPKSKNKVVGAAPTITNDALVAKYNKILEQALGDDPGFQATIAKLASDPEVSSSDMIALAKCFAVATTKTKAAALKKISARHAALMSSRARTAATAGRSAG
jgi:hypothetical protein